MVKRSSARLITNASRATTSPRW